MINKIKNINKLIDDYLLVLNTETRKRTLDDVSERLNSLYTKINRISKVVKTLDTSLNIKVHIDPNLAEEIALIQSKVMTETNEARARIRQMDTVMDNIEDDCKRKWSDYYSQNYGNLVGTLSVLVKIINDNELVNIRYNISRYRGKWPINETDINELEGLMVRAHNKIKALEMDKEIEEFLIKITSQDVRVTDLSNNVLDWLRKTGAAGHIVLKMID
ncbi:MAG: hypothetical protein WBI74_00640 [Caldicoprobacterales bacterium]|jgi:hypothetical protein